MGVPRTARDSASKPAVRGSPVIEKVLRATIRELARTGYGALSIEEVAARAGVNKTTIYRRWPTKADLVRAALSSLGDERVCHIDTGSLKKGLLGLGKSMVDFAQSLEGQSVLRMLFGERTEPELAAIASSVRREHEAIPKALIDEAIRRGDLPRGADALLLVETLAGAILHRMLLANEPVDDDFLHRLVDLLLRGAVKGGGSRLRRAK